MWLAVVLVEILCIIGSVCVGKHVGGRMSAWKLLFFSNIDLYGTIFLCDSYISAYVCTIIRWLGGFWQSIGYGVAVAPPQDCPKDALSHLL